MKLCVFDACPTNDSHQLPENVTLVQFPDTDYIDHGLRLLAEKRLYWWRRVCGLEDISEDNLKRLAICSKHFLKGTGALLQDIYNPDWLPTLNIPFGAVKRKRPTYVDFDHIIGSPTPKNAPTTDRAALDPVTLRIQYVDEIIAYPIARTFLLLDGKERCINKSHDIKMIPEPIKRCLTPSSSVGKAVFGNSSYSPDRLFPYSKLVTVDLSASPRWSTERKIMELQNSVYELIKLLQQTESDT